LCRCFSKLYQKIKPKLIDLKVEDLQRVSGHILEVYDVRSEFDISDLPSCLRLEENFEFIWSNQSDDGVMAYLILETAEQGLSLVKNFQFDEFKIRQIPFQKNIDGVKTEEDYLFSAFLVSRTTPK